MDQNAIRLTKIYYRKSLLVHILSYEEIDISNTLKNMNLKDTMFLLAVLDWLLMQFENVDTKYFSIRTMMSQTLTGILKI